MNPGPRSTHKRQQIEQLLRWLPEAVDGGGGISDWIGTEQGSKLLTFGPLWNRSFAELVRCLQQLKAGHYVHHAHLVARYHGGHTLRRTVRVIGGRITGLNANEEIRFATSTPEDAKAKTKGTRTEDVTVYWWPAWVRQVEVDAGLDWLERNFVGEPYLPKELIAA